MSNCGLPDGVVHQHVERCYQAGLKEGRAEALAPVHVVHTTNEPVAEDVVWCDVCEEWVTSGPSEQP